MNVEIIHMAQPYPMIVSVPLSALHITLFPCKHTTIIIIMRVFTNKSLQKELHTALTTHDTFHQVDKTAL